MAKGKFNSKVFATKALEKLKAFSKTIWFFPTILFLIVMVLGALQISGSSIGIYHELLYGDSSKDENLLVNKPRPVRSDEWLVTTQLTLGQTKNNFLPINPNIGNGIDVSLLVDAPTSDFSQLFKPHNLVFFVLPVGIAFALKWWLLAYFLVVSVYFFVLTLLPEKRLLATLLSLSFLASPFIVWWYQYITLAPIYYALFGIVVAIKLIHSRNIKTALLWGVLLAYISTSFALVLYPPFQIPCALFAVAFLVGYILDRRKSIAPKYAFLGGGAAVLITILLSIICLVPKLDVIGIVSNTAYPGNRITESGGFNPILFFANDTSLLAQSNSRAGAFSLLANQSEGSNFLIVFVLLTPLLMFLAIKYRKRIPNFWTIIALILLTTLYMAWLFIPNIDMLGNITLLNRVIHARLLIGFGLINLLAVVLSIQIIQEKHIKLSKHIASLYASIIFIFYILINLYIAKNFPGFMGEKWAMMLALPYPVIIYLLLRARFALALIAFLIFSIASVMFVHPLYRGVDILKDSKLSQAIRQVDTGNNKRWVTDSLQLENYAVLNGKQSLSGVYVYPDLGLWQGDFPKSDLSKYNRYSHVHFQFDRNANKSIDRKLDQPSPDQLIPTIEPCDPFLRDKNVGYILTTQIFTPQQAPCVDLLRQVNLPKAIVYIYQLRSSMR